MLELNRTYIRREIADSEIIYQRGIRLFEHGAFMLADADPANGCFDYQVDGSFGDYNIHIQLTAEGVSTACDCPYPGAGCKHTVAALIDAGTILADWRRRESVDTPAPLLDRDKQGEILTAAEIKAQALEDRKKRARSELFTVTAGDMLKGEHLVETEAGRQYTVTFHDPTGPSGHCTCPDYISNRLGTCKHMIHLSRRFAKMRDYQKRAARERFPFVDIYWDSVNDCPRLFNELPPQAANGDLDRLAPFFDTDGIFRGRKLADLMPAFDGLYDNKKVRIQESVLQRIDDEMRRTQLEDLAVRGVPPLKGLKADLYPYQNEGVAFALYRPGALIGDEMGLGKTLQAIALGILKKEIFDFEKVLVVTLASLKEQWRREIEKFSSEKAIVVAGTPDQRRHQYFNDRGLFKITNYEAVLRDVTLLSRFKPDLIILDEAQRIKNFSTKTADAVKRIPRKHALVLTGTPLENKLEDVYSIVQFLDPDMLSPLWQFAADHFMLSRRKKGKIIGYQNLERLHERLSSIVIRRRKADVLQDLPDEIVNNYYLEMTDEQQQIHSGYIAALLPLLNKKYLTPVDHRRIMELLIKARMVCDSTYLIDRKTHLSPKLKELEGILQELVQENGHKVVIFSEWTTMTFLIGRYLSEAGISFVELSGKVPVKKRQALIDEFSRNPECKVFLSTDAGGTGLNLQAADCVVNFELPWNPARLNQRIGRVNRIGQQSRCVNVVNLISKDSIEEKILTGIQLKTDLFKGVFDGGLDKVEFSREKRTQMLNRLREMMNEEPVPIVHEAADSEELADDTPGFLNPKALEAADAAEAAEKQPPLDIFGEEEPSVETSTPTPTPAATAEAPNPSAAPAQSPEKMEAVLNSGMAFLGGLMEMATGRKMPAAADDGRMVSVNKETGEVTLKFKLPGF